MIAHRNSAQPSKVSRVIALPRRIFWGAFAAGLTVGILFAGPLSVTWAKPKADNTKLMSSDDGPSYLTGYLIVIGSLAVGLTAVCRKSYRTAEIKQAGDKQK
ncbi:MAG TPA: hypothetical protein VMF30_03735 [Pirellulales bacterium]|nr:hypothetical protein [Pirellulales bacterium]